MLYNFKSGLKAGVRPVVLTARLPSTIDFIALLMTDLLALAPETTSSKITLVYVAHLGSMMSTWAGWLRTICNKQQFKLKKLADIRINRAPAPQDTWLLSRLWKWVPHQLTETQHQCGVEEAVLLLYFRCPKTWMNSIVTRNEAWVLYPNSQCKWTWRLPGATWNRQPCLGSWWKWPCSQPGGRAGPVAVWTPDTGH